MIDQEKFVVNSVINHITHKMGKRMTLQVETERKKCFCINNFISLFHAQSQKI